MALHRWPTDKPGKAPSHTISWDQHQANLTANRNPAKPGEVKISTPGGFVPISEWDFGYGKGVTQPPAAPAAPAKPAFDPTAPLPVDPTYDAEMGGLIRQRDTALSGLTGARSRGLKNFGFTEAAFDPATQTMGALAFDPNNPFSKAALLKKSYDTGRASARQTMGAGGQLYAGAFQNQQDLLNRKQLEGEDTLQKSLAEFLAGNTGQRTQAQTDFELGSSSAYADRVARAKDSALYDPTVPEPAAPAPGDTQEIGTAATGGKPKKKKPKTLKAGPGVKATKNTTVKKTKKGRTVTYTTSVKGP